MSLQSKLLEWLRTTGYPFQLHAGRALQSAGWHVNYSRWYRDPVTSKLRELDLQALIGAVRPGESSLFFSLVIECKSSSSQPWVGLSSSKDGGGRSFLASAPGGMTRSFALAAQFLELTVPQLLPSDTLYADSVIAGFVEDPPGDQSPSSKRGKPKEQSDPTSPHSALMQAVSAASALDTEFLNTALTARPEIATATALLPVVLLRGRLFAYTVAADLQDELLEVGALLVSVPTDNEDRSTLVAVLTEEGAKAVWKPMLTAAHQFCVSALPHARRIANALTVSESEMEKNI